MSSSLVPTYGSINNENIQQDVESRTLTVVSSNKSLSRYLKKTSIRKEIKFVILNAVPIVLTFLMQYSLTVSCLFVIGNLCIDPETGSSAEYLSSASLAVMTYNITGLAAIEGMATSLDTFCPQAYGASKYKKVGLYTQRCTLMIMCILTPIVISWWFSASWLKFVIPEADGLLVNVQTYLRLLSFGLPAIIMFETGKRFAQSQGYYKITTFSLSFIFPINILLIYIFTKKFGFIGAPCAIVISDWLMFLSLTLYCIYVKPDTLKCWPSILKYKEEEKEEEESLRVDNESNDIFGTPSQSLLFTVDRNCTNNKKKRHPIFQHWLPMWNLSFPGLVMIESEYLSFELLTIMSTYFGVEAIAAQTIIATIGTLIYQIPFAFGCVISTRIAHYIGSYYHIHCKNSDYPVDQSIAEESVVEPKLAEYNAKTTIKATYILAFGLGFVTFVLLFVSTEKLARLFTKDETVIKLSSHTLPVIAVNQIPYSFNIFSSSIMRGQGRQSICSKLNIVGYYAIGLPLSYIFAYKMNLYLSGLWLGCTCSVLFLGSTQIYYVIKTNWKSVFGAFIKRMEVEDVEI
ncbi:uncharacterized protein SCODWIG_02706 [Saccharomycodes ludwigii]|uniref:Ethionine resistance-conferring protein 1 n=1 Tax=Saccharomycodes ludwigii TaxID=36035 RepID=A0A376B8F2_9ASCO|nr:hypothetical protein SCDLUD_004621 [Saccharomycodes ludwigii]KAH3899191.1 hypothetical protein SCDLUD_004621 [Saccharomycodes ludwigii]SSD60945.1 uncharacterized protein SCODWIG_02706 [Saccharomycodes ludwigii]